MKTKMGGKVVLLGKVLIALGVFMGCRAVSLCGMTDEELDECKPAVSGLMPSDPTTDCCTYLSKANLTCFCEYKDSPMLPLLGIDPDLALQLPVKCNLTPVPTQC
ncbi:hypothetical protein ACLOJK_023998 [Asimina triloba]